MKTNVSNEPTMKADLRTKCDEIRTLMTDGNKKEVHAKYSIGLAIVMVQNDSEKYGKGSVRVVASELGCTAALLYSYAAVASTWTPDAFEVASARDNAKGISLTFSHFIELSKVKNAQKREALLTAALEEAWSLRSLLSKMPRLTKKLSHEPKLVAARMVAESKRAVSAMKAESVHVSELDRAAVDDDETRSRLEQACRNYEQVALEAAKAHQKLSALLGHERVATKKSAA